MEAIYKLERFLSISDKCKYPVELYNWCSGFYSSVESAEKSIKTIVGLKDTDLLKFSKTEFFKLVMISLDTAENQHKDEKMYLASGTHNGGILDKMITTELKFSMQDRVVFFFADKLYAGTVIMTPEILSVSKADADDFEVFKHSTYKIRVLNKKKILNIYEYDILYKL